MTLEEKKTALIKRPEYKNNPALLTAVIAEVVFDITDNAHCFDQQKVIDNDSRDLFQAILSWSWEFEYNWEFGEPIYEAYSFEPDRESKDYFLEIDYFAQKKIKEYFKED